MKKLDLQLGSIKAMLTKEQMKKIVGGYVDPCDDQCENDGDCPEGLSCVDTPDPIDCDNPPSFKECCEG
jgi:natural product precursor